MKCILRQPILILVRFIERRLGTDCFTNPPSTAILQSDLFKTSEPDIALPGIKHPVIFRQVARFLAEMGAKEIEHGGREVFTQWKGKGGKFSKQLSSELFAYARGQWPFNVPIGDDQGVGKWWNILVGSEAAQILPVRRILSIMTLPPAQNDSKIITASRHKTIRNPRELYARGTDRLNLHLVDPSPSQSTLCVLNYSNDPNTSALSHRINCA